MERSGVKRLICQTTLGIGDSVDSLNFYWRYLMFGGVMRKIYTEHTKQEEIIKASTLDWTIVRPSAFTDDALSDGYQHGSIQKKARNLTFKIGRADVAKFMLNQLADATYLYKTPGLTH